MIHAVVPAAFPAGLSSVALAPDCTVYARLLYPFFHASLLHAVLNCWTLLVIVFYYNIGIGALLLSYLVAVTVPCSVCGYGIATTPTVGLSSVIFCLLGIIPWRVKRKLYYHSWIAGIIAMGFCLPSLLAHCGLPTASPNNLLHIYCYVVGLMVGFLNAPAPWQRK
jgi:membrane associated rhomboid family serine protease